MTKISYPKKPHDIQIQVTRQRVTSGKLSDSQDVSVVALNVKLYEYAIRVGSVMAGVLVQLFANGKVRVDLGGYSERLELVDKENQMSPSDAMRLFEEFVADIEKTGVQLFKKSTQHMVLTPRASSGDIPMAGPTAG